MNIADSRLNWPRGRFIENESLLTPPPSLVDDIISEQLLISVLSVNIGDIRGLLLPNIILYIWCNFWTSDLDSTFSLAAPTYTLILCCTAYSPAGG